MANKGRDFEELFINDSKTSDSVAIDSIPLETHSEPVENIAETSENSVPKQKKGKLLNTRMAFIASGILVLAIAVGVFLYLSSGKNNEVDSQNVVPSVSNASVSTEVESEVGEELEKLQSVLAVRDAQISAYIAQIKKLQTTLSATNSALQQSQDELTAYMTLHSVETLSSTETEQFVKKVVVKGISLNSIYPGSAVLVHKNKTYVVRVGDTVNGVDILGIDSNNRQVKTSAGVIQ